MKIYFFAKLIVLSFLVFSFMGCDPNPTPTPLGLTCYIKKINYKADTAIVFNYNSANKLIEQKFMKGATELSKVTYTYNAQGNVATKTWLDGGLTMIMTYIYDANQQLIAIQTPPPYSPFTYLVKANVTFVADNTNKIISEKAVDNTIYSNGNTKQLLSSFSYDGNNNTTSVETIASINNAYTYLVQEKLPTVTYTFDNKKNPFKGLPPYSHYISNTMNGFVSDYFTTQNPNNIIAITSSGFTKNYGYTYNSEGYPLQSTTPNNLNITYEYECK